MNPPSRQLRHCIAADWIRAWNGISRSKSGEMPTQLNIQVRGFGAMVLGQIAYLEPVRHGHLCTHRIDFTILWD